MTRHFKQIILLGVAACAVPQMAEADSKGDSFNPVQTGVNSLSIAPDARGASMGDIGAATEPDANSQFWNPAGRSATPRG